jgi:AcrR family transcriptional regulator
MLVLTNMKTSRQYTMRARAASAEETRRRVLAAAGDLLRRRLRSDIRLDDIAAGAGVTVPTVLRIFGRKDQLFQLAFDELVAEMSRQLGSAAPGDVDTAVRTWFDHYETFGDVVMNSLAEEHDPAVAPIVRFGRARHRERVENVLAPRLERFTEDERTRVVDALVCASDVYTWKLLRRDNHRPRPEAEATMKLMIDSILGGG